MKVIGIDVGKNGAFAIVDDLKLVDFMVMPAVGKDIDTRRIVEYITNNPVDHIFLEFAQAMPKNGAVSMFRYGKNFGILIGILAALKVPHTLVRPKEWQKRMFRGTDSEARPKDRAFLSALRVFPDSDFIATPRSRKPHEGVVDAALIGYYGCLELNGND